MYIKNEERDSGIVIEKQKSGWEPGLRTNI